MSLIISVVIIDSVGNDRITRYTTGMRNLVSISWISLMKLVSRIAFDCEKMAITKCIRLEEASHNK